MRGSAVSRAGPGTSRPPARGGDVQDVLAHLGVRRGVQRGLPGRGHPDLLRALHLAGRERHERLQRARRHRPGRPLAGRGPGRVAGGLRAHQDRAPRPRRRRPDHGRRPLPGPLAGVAPRVASWPPTPTTSACPRSPRRPPAGAPGGPRSPASRWTRCGRRSRSRPAPDGGTLVRAGGAEAVLDDAELVAAVNGRLPGRPPARSRPASRAQRPGMTGLHGRHLRRPHRRGLRRALRVRRRDRRRRRAPGRAGRRRSGPRARDRHRPPGPPPRPPRPHRARASTRRRRWSPSSGPSPAATPSR